MKTRIHNATEPATFPVRQAAARIPDQRPQAAGQTRLKDLADSSPQANNLLTLQAKADAAGARQRRHQTSPQGGLVAQLEGDGSVLPFGPMDYLLLFFVIWRMLSAVAGAPRMAYTRLSTNRAVQDEVVAVRDELPAANREEQAAALGPRIETEVAEAASDAIGPAVSDERNSPSPADAVERAADAESPEVGEVAAPNVAQEVPPDLRATVPPDVLPSASLVQPPSLDLPGVQSGKEDANEIALPTAVPKPKPVKRSPAKKGNSSSRGHGKAEKDEGGASPSSSGTQFSAEFIESYKDYRDMIEKDELNEEEYSTVGLISPQFVAAYRRYLWETEESEKSRLRKEERERILASEDLQRDRRRTGMRAAEASMDHELATAFQNRKPSGDHYFTWEIDGAKYHVTVRGGDTPHVTREGAPETHYFFHFGGEDGFVGTLPTVAERGANDIYLSMDNAPAKVRRFMKLYIGVKDGLFK